MEKTSEKVPSDEKYKQNEKFTRSGLDAVEETIIVTLKLTAIETIQDEIQR